MKRKKGWIALLLFLLLAYWAWQRWSTEDSLEANKDNTRLLLDRLWIDQLPETETDYANIFVALSDAPLGVFQKSSNYHMEAELFQFRRDGKSVKLVFPQRDKKASFKFKISRCNELPPFDLCLDLSKNPWGGPKRYYGSLEQSAALDGGLLRPLHLSLLPQKDRESR